MISLVCVYNNEEVFNRYLAKSLEGQAQAFELITLDNTQGKFKSAAEALNYGGKKAKGKYLLFVHQDVGLPAKTWLGDVEMMMDSLPGAGIAGVAGCDDGGRVHTNIEHGDPPRPAGDVPVDQPEKVQTIDECLFIIPRSAFDELHFDAVTCDDWHLYAADFALSCRKTGREAYVLPLSAYHLSDGTKGSRVLGIFPVKRLPKEYYRTLGELLKKHRDSFPFIGITCGRWSTSRPLLFQRIGYFLKYCRTRLGV